jgi:hypothetical protein
MLFFEISRIFCQDILADFPGPPFALFMQLRFSEPADGEGLKKKSSKFFENQTIKIVHLYTPTAGIMPNHSKGRTAILFLTVHAP